MNDCPQPLLATQALKPCPFCGGQAEWREDDGRCGVPFGLVVDHQPTCFLRLPLDEGEMIAAWNDRHLSTGAEELAALEGLVTDENDDPCWRDHNGLCQAHFLEQDCSMAHARNLLRKAGRI